MIEFWKFRILKILNFHPFYYTRTIDYCVMLLDTGANFNWASWQKTLSSLVVIF